MAEARSRLRPESLSPDLDPLADEPAFPTPSDPSTCAEDLFSLARDVLRFITLINKE